MHHDSASRDQVGKFIMRVRIVAPVVMVWCLLGGAAAQEPVAHNPDATHIQLPSFMAPVQTLDGGWATAPMTVFLETRLPEDARAVCKLVPRVQDAVMQDLFANPVPLDPNSRMKLAGIGDRLIVAVNRALNHSPIIDVHILEGVPGNGVGGAKFAQWKMCRYLPR